MHAHTHTVGVFPSLQDGTPLQGVGLECLAARGDSELRGPHRFLLQGLTTPYENPTPPGITALDCHPVCAHGVLRCFR
jgi:hypothetical protein